MKSCHIGPVFLLKCVSHVILKSLSDLIFGSQIAQFRFLPFVDNVMCSEEWIQVAGSCGVIVGCDRPGPPGAAVRTCVVEGLTCPSEICVLAPLRASLNASPVREVCTSALGK